MSTQLRRATRSLASVLAGYAVIVIATSAGFTPLGGIVHLDAPVHIHLLGALVAVIAGTLGGFVAGWVAGRQPVLHAAAVLIIIALETAILLSRGSTDPAWFEISASLTLMLATVAGGFLYSRTRGRSHPTHAAP